MPTETQYAHDRRNLLDHYAAYRQSIEQEFWYAEALLCGDRRHFGNALHSENFLEIDSEQYLVSGVTKDSQYWVAQAEYHSHMQNLALSELGRDKPRVRKADFVEQNKNFADFPVRYDNQLRDRLIDDIVRVVQFNRNGISLQKANYLDQLTTNIQPDQPIGGTLETFRSLDKDGSGLRSFENCRQANSIGVAGILIDFVGTPVLRMRGSAKDFELAIMSNGWHVGVSGTLKWQDLLARDGQGCVNGEQFVEGLKRGLLREFGEEAMSLEKSGQLYCRLFGFARELKRAGKPQFFFTIQFRDKNCEQVIELLWKEKLPYPEYEKGRFSWAPKAGYIKQRPDWNVRHPNFGYAFENRPYEFTFECLGGHYLLQKAIKDFGFKVSA